MTADPWNDKKAPFSTPPPFPWLHLFLALGMISLFALSNASILKLMDVFDPDDWGAFWVYLTAGGMCAQLSLLAIWGAIGLGKTWARQLSVVGVGSIWIASWCAGPAFLENGLLGEISAREAAPTFCLPLLLLSMQMPLWVHRVLGRWRLASENASIASRPPQMSIAGILGAMTLVGISLALVRLGLQVSEMNAPGAWWIGVVITCASFSAASLIIRVPVCFLVLRLRSWVAGIVLSILYLSSVAMLAWIGAFSIMGNFGGGPFQTYIALPTTFCGFAGGLLLPLMLLRLANYRLRWGRE
ncbi:MAG: hypothetical protein ACR2FY_19940 [Pirellulaceae bacterium]